MTKLLEKAVEAARHLPPAAQDDMALVVLQLLARTPEEQAALWSGPAQQGTTGVVILADRRHANYRR
jgi:hypothetical protein